MDRATVRLGEAGLHEPRREAEVLLGLVTGMDRGGVVARRPDPVTTADAVRFDELVSRRAAREPLQYITGEQEFRGLTFEVDGSVLIPRPETEELVGLFLTMPLRPGARVLDAGTGSGCIAVALAVERPDLEIVAVDNSPQALSRASANAERHGVSGRIEFMRCSVGEAPARWDGSMDAVISNPPYVRQGDWEQLQPEVRDHEPKGALVPGPSGLEGYEMLAPAAYRLLRPGGLLAVELGYDSEKDATRLFSEAGFTGIEVRRDMRGIPRMLTATREMV